MCCKPPSVWRQVQLAPAHHQSSSPSADVKESSAQHPRFANEVLQYINRRNKWKKSALQGGAWGRARSGSESFVPDDLAAPLSPEERQRRLELAAMLAAKAGGKATHESLLGSTWPWKWMS